MVINSYRFQLHFVLSVSVTERELGSRVDVLFEGFDGSTGGLILWSTSFFYTVDEVMYLSHPWHEDLLCNFTDH